MFAVSAALAMPIAARSTGLLALLASRWHMYVITNDTSLNMPSKYFLGSREEVA